MSARYWNNLDRVLPEDAADGAPTVTGLHDGCAVSRRVQTCDVCLTPIPAGEEHHVHSYRLDGEREWQRYHLRCAGEAEE